MNVVQNKTTKMFFRMWGPLNLWGPLRPNSLDTPDSGPVWDTSCVCFCRKLHLCLVYYLHMHFKSDKISPKPPYTSLTPIHPIQNLGIPPAVTCTCRYRPNSITLSSSRAGLRSASEVDSTVEFGRMRAGIAYLTVHTVFQIRKTPTHGGILSLTDSSVHLQ